jgi:hypothetical protein
LLARGLRSDLLSVETSTDETPQSRPGPPEFIDVPRIDAVVTGAILLMTRRVKPEKVYREIDGSLLVLFGGSAARVATLAMSFTLAGNLSW